MTCLSAISLLKSLGYYVHQYLWSLVHNSKWIPYIILMFFLRSAAVEKSSNFFWRQRISNNTLPNMWLSDWHSKAALPNSDKPQGLVHDYYETQREKHEERQSEFLCFGLVPSAHLTLLSKVLCEFFQLLQILLVDCWLCVGQRPHHVRLQRRTFLQY